MPDLGVLIHDACPDDKAWHILKAAVKRGDDTVLLNSITIEDMKENPL